MIRSIIDKLLRFSDTNLFVAISTFVFAVTFIALGWLLGARSNTTQFINVIWTWLVDVGTILAGFGTATAAFFASQALSSWKAQFNHAEKF